MHNASCLHLLCGLWSTILTLLHLLQTYDHILKTQTCWPSASTLRSDAPTLWFTLQDLHNAACLQFRLCLFQTHHTHINRKQKCMMFFVSTPSVPRSNLLFNIKVEQAHIVLERSVKLNLRPWTWRRIRNVFGKYSKNSLNFQFPHLLSQQVPKKTCWNFDTLMRDCNLAPRVCDCCKPCRRAAGAGLGSNMCKLEPRYNWWVETTSMMTTTIRWIESGQFPQWTFCNSAHVI